MPRPEEPIVFTYSDLQKLADREKNTIHQASKRGMSGETKGEYPLVKSDLRSVILWVAANGTSKLKAELIAAAVYNHQPTRRVSAKRAKKKARPTRRRSAAGKCRKSVQKCLTR